MVCNVCGRTIANEEANFCEYCGASFREMKLNQNQYQEISNTNSPLGSQSSEVMYSQNEPFQQGNSTIRDEFRNEVLKRTQNRNQKAEMTFWGWLGVMLVPFLPVLGPVIYLVILCTWAFGQETEPTKKNWARATLVVLIFCFVILVLFTSMLLSSAASSGMTLEEYVNTMNRMK